MTLTPPSLLLEIALPVPLRRSFDYLPPTNLSPEQLAQLEPGILIRVPFGRQELIGILLRSKNTSDQPSHKLRPALALIDNQPVLESELLELCLWAADYYQ
jgi:primosomal protein N' (replication factor Y)